MRGKTPAPPRARCLRAPRQIGITSNRCHAGSLRGVAVRGYYLIVVITCSRVNTSHCSAASTRTPPAQGSRRAVYLRIKPAQRATNDSPSGTNRSLLSISRFAGFLGSSIAYSTGLPSRRAGGGFGHPVRLVLPRIGVMPRVYVVRPLIYQNCCALGAEHAVCLLSTVHAMPRFSKRGCFLVDKYQKRSTATSICWRNSYLCLTI